MPFSDTRDNSKRIDKSNLKEKNLIYLLRRNIKIKRFSIKLNHTKLNLYSIQKVLDKSIYKLKLSDIIRIHFIFNISLLKSILKNVK